MCKVSAFHTAHSWPLHHTKAKPIVSAFHISYEFKAKALGYLGLPSGGSDGKESAYIPWKREELPTPGFLPGEFQGQRSLVGYSPCGRNGIFNLFSKRKYFWGKVHGDSQLPSAPTGFPGDSDGKESA